MSDNTVTCQTEICVEERNYTPEIAEQEILLNKHEDNTPINNGLIKQITGGNNFFAYSIFDSDEPIELKFPFLQRNNPYRQLFPFPKHNNP